jgi:hypothetical protein
MEDRNWRHWTGTAFMAAAVVAFVTNWISPPPEGSSPAYLTGFYSLGIVFLGVGWWLRRSAGD